MKTEPIIPARIDWSGAVPRSLEFGDLYHPQVGALEQARHVFLRGNRLPERWRGRARFTVLETGFGLGANFLATWQAWRDDPGRPTWLHYVAIERHPPLRGDLARTQAHRELPALAAELQRQWPPLTPNLHELDFDGARVQLLLAFGDVAALLPQLRCTVDAYFLDGYAPAANPAMWDTRVLRALGRKAAPGATASTWSVARSVRDGLAAAGFEVERAAGHGDKREISVARIVPHRLRRQAADDSVAGTDAAANPSPSWGAPVASEALVVGAGIAGAAAAAALRRQGFEVMVFERQSEPATEASGNPGGLVHGGLAADDGAHARLLRAAALRAAREYGPLVDAGRIVGSMRGLLWLDHDPGGIEALAARGARSGLPPDYVHLLDPAQAAALAGAPLTTPAWLYPGGGWVAPRQAVPALLEGSRLVAGCEVAALQRAGGLWRLLDAGGRVLGEAPVLVLANAAQAQTLLARLEPAPWPLTCSRGQVSWLRTAAPTQLGLPLTGDGYALSLADGRLLCGATRVPGDPGLELRDADHAWNAGRARRLTGLDLPRDAQAWEGRVGQRLHTPDRLPIAGAVVAPGAAAVTQARRLAREPGLYVLTALGARGLTWAPLLGRLLAAMASGSPWPLEQDLADAIDPGRWRVRAARQAGAARTGAPQPQQSDG